MAETECHIEMADRRYRDENDGALRGQKRKGLGRPKLLLETRGYRVQLAAAEREVLIVSQQGCYEDVKLLICTPEEYCDTSLQRMQAAVPYMKLVLLERKRLRR